MPLKVETFIPNGYQRGAQMPLSVWGLSGEALINWTDRPANTAWAAAGPRR